MNMNELLGKKAKANVSGFEGTVTALCVYLYGPMRVCLTAKSIDGKKPEEYWADEADVEIVEESDNERTEPVFQND